MEPETTVAQLLDAIAATTGGKPTAETTIDVLRAMSIRVLDRPLPGYFEWSWGADDDSGEPDLTTIIIDIPARAEGRRDALPITAQISLTIHINRTDDLLFSAFILETPANDFQDADYIDRKRGGQVSDVEITPFEVLTEVLDGTLQTLVVSRRKRRLLGGKDVQTSERWVRRSSDGGFDGPVTPREIELLQSGQMPFALLVEFAVDAEDDVTYTVRDAQGSILRSTPLTTTN